MLKESHDVALFISSLPPRVRRLNQLLRDHWSIENSEHYVLDVVLARTPAASAPARPRKWLQPRSADFLLNILQQDTSLKENIRGKRLRAGWDEAILDGIYTAFQAAWNMRLP
ncbi:MAG: hypothetical protein R3B91_22445 [Planctomycetaceae bacterium]